MKLALIIATFLYTFAGFSSVNSEENLIAITFNGTGRLYSREDEMAKPMCKNNAMNSGEYILHYNRIGTKDSKQLLYPFAVYVPAIGSAQSTLDFVNCLDEKANCPKPTIKSGTRWSQQHLINNSGLGKHLLVVGAGHSEDDIRVFSNIVKRMNDDLISTPLRQASLKYVELDMEMIASSLNQQMKNHIGSKIFNVTNPGDCEG